MASHHASTNPAGVARILYKEIVEGDVRKTKAKSNDSKSGGGARDFRFGDFKKLEPIIRKMFPNSTIKKRRRDGASVKIEVFRGTFHWNLNNAHESKEVEFESPTTARPNEGRITQVPKQPALAPELIPKFDKGNKVLLLLVQQNDGSVWPHFIQESSLAEPGAWDPVVAAELLKCINAKRAANRVVIGYRDFASGEGYCNGK